MKTVTVGIVDYGSAGNILNVARALTEAGGKVSILKDPRDFRTVERLVLPGVGAYPEAMRQLEPMKNSLLESVLGKPTLGICLGMQLLASVGFEGQETTGLNLVNAEVRKMEVKAKVPHLGWGKVRQVKESPLFRGITQDSDFYFMHSYELVNYTEVLALTDYHNHRFVSGIQKGQLFGVQFHPEKSREQGIALLKNFLHL